MRPIDQDGLNLRSGPGTSYAVVGALAQGEAATILTQEGEWYKIRLASGSEGWVAGWFSRVSYEDEERYASVNTDVLNVRREPDLNAPVLTRLVQDQRVRLLESTPEWWRIRLDDGTEGWVAAVYMLLAPASSGPAAQPTTPATPTTPPTPPTAPATPPTPAETAPPVSLPPAPTAPTAPPAAPAGTVPDLLVHPPRALSPLPGVSVSVLAETGVYAGPNSEARRVDTVWAGETLRLLDAAGGWVRAETPRGKRGWIHGSLVRVYDGRLVHDLAEQAWVLEAMGSLPATASPTPAPATEGSSLRVVADPEGLNLRLIPSIQARSLGVLPQGERLEVLDTSGSWFKVSTSTGQIGWVNQAYTIPVGDPSGQPAAAPAPVISSDGFTASLSQPFAGAIRLVLETGGTAVGKPVLAEGRLTIPFPTGEPEARPIPLNLMGVRQAVVDPAGLLVDLIGQPVLAVEEEAPGRLVLLLRPALTGLTQELVDGKQVLRFAMNGETQPVAREAGPNIIIEFPGAVLGAPIVVDGIRVVEHETGVRMAIPSYRSFALKRSEQGYYLVIYPPGLSGKAILLDPGHGGDDGGAVSRLLGVVEEQVNLELSLRVRALLEAKGARVYMTRATDSRPAPESYLDSSPDEPRDQLDMQYRTAMANQLKVDLFLSIHHNAGDPGDRGTETYYTSTTLNGERSRTLARLIQEELTPSLGTINRGAKDDTYFVTRNTEAPAALVEVAFVNDPVEGPRTKDPAVQEAAAQAIVRAIERLYAERPH